MGWVVVVERPDWSVLEGVLGEVRRGLDGLQEVQRRMLTVTGVAWSEDRMVRVVVGPRGHLVELEIDPRVFRRPDSRALAALIVDTVRRAVESSSRRVREIIDEATPGDMRVGGVGGFDFRRLMETHDADLSGGGESGE